MAWSQQLEDAVHPVDLVPSVPASAERGPRHSDFGAACREGRCVHVVAYPGESGWGPSARDRWPDAGPHGGWMLKREHPAQ